MGIQRFLSLVEDEKQKVFPDMINNHIFCVLTLSTIVSRLRISQNGGLKGCPPQAGARAAPPADSLQEASTSGDTQQSEERTVQ